MRLAVIAVGRMKAGPERALADRYRARATETAARLGWSSLDMHELSESRNRSVELRRAEEAERIAARLGGARAVAFDERGSTRSSEDLAATLAGWRDAGHDATCIIGGPDGLDQAVRDRANLVLGFGRLTIPHQLVRVLVFEQLYRVATILSGHPYHRGDAAEP